MASSSPTLPAAYLASSLSTSRKPYFSPKPYLSISPISCGPRDNRGPLLRGRVLSSEAILAVQSLKRAFARSISDDSHLSATLSRLIKTDLLASLRELLRQNHSLLALRVFAAARREAWYRTDYALYAEIVAALARNGMSSEIDRLVSELLEEEGFYAGGDDRGLTRLLKALIAAERPNAVVDVYGMMRRGRCEMDEFMFKVLSRGLRRLGEIGAADEVERDFSSSSDGKFERSVSD